MAAAPPAAPPAQASPVPAPPPQPAVPTQSGGQSLAGEMSDRDAFGVLDSMIAEPKPTPPQEPTEHAAPETKPEPTQPPPTPPKETTRESPPKDATTGKFVKAATLRENYDRLKSEYKALQEKHAAMEAKEAERAQQPNGEAHYKELQERYETLQKQHAERENELRFSNFERSQEYKDRYEKPMMDAYASGRAKVASLKVVERKNDMDEVVQPIRQGTTADFDSIMATSDDDQAAEMASNLFGAKAPVVLYHRERVQETNNARIRAIEDYRKQGTEREQQMMQMAERQRSEVAQLYQGEVTASKGRYKDWFGPVEGDAEGNTLLEQGEAIADLAFGTLSPENITKLPPKLQERLKAGQFDHKEMVRLHAAIRNKASGFDRLAKWHKRDLARIKELETKLAEYDQSEPGRGEGGGRTPAPQEDNMESVLASMDNLPTSM